MSAPHYTRRIVLETDSKIIRPSKLSIIGKLEDIGAYSQCKPITNLTVRRVTKGRY